MSKRRKKPMIEVEAMHLAFEILAVAAEDGVKEEDGPNDSLLSQYVQRINKAREMNLRKGVDIAIEGHGLICVGRLSRRGFSIRVLPANASQPRRNIGCLVSGDHPRQLTR